MFTKLSLSKRLRNTHRHATRMYKRLFAESPAAANEVVPDGRPGTTLREFAAYHALRSTHSERETPTLDATTSSIAFHWLKSHSPATLRTLGLV